MIRVSSRVLVVAAGAVALGGCAPVRTTDDANPPVQRGCEGCVLLDVRFIDLDEEALRTLGFECPLSDEAGK